MRAHRAKKLWVKKSQPQRAIASHGNATDAPGFTARGDAVATLDRGHEFLQEEILIAEAAIVRVDEKTGVAGGTDDHEIAEFAAVPERLHHVAASGAHGPLLVVA